MRKVLRYVVLVCVAFAVLALPAFADPPSPDNPAGHENDILGVTPSKNASHSSSGGNLVYHGGSVMHTNRTYAIYWEPSGSTVSPAYNQTISTFLADVAADSGKTSNVYYSDTQYYQSIGSTTYVKYSSTFGGSVVDTNPFPASGCSDSVAQTSVCLSDAQLQAELTRVKAAQGWVSSPTTLFFIFTPKGVGSCYDSADCAFSQYCAYHSSYGSGSSVTLYANQPYTDTVPADCDATAHPNGDEADPTINVVSHEHNEAITDPLGNAWYDLAGYENGDKCAWTFGTAIGSTPTGAYNQLINGHPYELQREYSNARSNCVLTGT
jgi:hypothetical protein